jgi:hypothetical protein
LYIQQWWISPLLQSPSCRLGSWSGRIVPHPILATHLLFEPWYGILCVWTI